MRLAFDQNVSNTEIGRLVRLGFEIVCIAGKSEPDEEWIERAMEADADIIFSDDFDVPNYLDRMGYDEVRHMKMWMSRNLIEDVRSMKAKRELGYE